MKEIIKYFGILILTMGLSVAIASQVADYNKDAGIVILVGPTFLFFAFELIKDFRETGDLLPFLTKSIMLTGFLSIPATFILENPNILITGIYIIGITYILGWILSGFRIFQDFFLQSKDSTYDAPTLLREIKQDPQVILNLIMNPITYNKAQKDIEQFKRITDLKPTDKNGNEHRYNLTATYKDNSKHMFLMVVEDHTAEDGTPAPFIVQFQRFS